MGLVTDLNKILLQKSPATIAELLVNISKAEVDLRYAKGLRFSAILC